MLWECASLGVVMVLGRPCRSNVLLPALTHFTAIYSYTLSDLLPTIPYHHDHPKYIAMHKVAFELYKNHLIDDLGLDDDDAMHELLEPLFHDFVDQDLQYHYDMLQESCFYSFTALLESYLNGLVEDSSSSNDDHKKEVASFYSPTCLQAAAKVMSHLYHRDELTCCDESFDDDTTTIDETIDTGSDSDDTSLDESPPPVKRLVF